MQVVLPTVLVHFPTGIRRDYLVQTSFENSVCEREREREREESSVKWEKKEEAQEKNAPAIASESHDAIDTNLSKDDEAHVSPVAIKQVNHTVQRAQKSTRQLTFFNAC